MAKPKPRTTPASRARTQVRAQARDTMRQRAANTGAKPRLAAGVKPGTPVATGKGPLQKNTMSGKPKSGGRIVPPSPPKPPKGPGKGPQLPPLPKNPVRGTTNTIRATGGGSKYAKINRLSAQAAKPPARPMPRGPKVMPGGMGKAVSSAMSLRKLTPAGLAYETLKARPTADGTLAYNQKLAASIMKKKKKG